MSNSKICEHITEIKEVKVGDDYVCEECIKHGGDWVHLRTCQTCGITLCCDSSPMKHMTAHFHETGHPVIASAEPEERWLWCNADSVMVSY